MGINRAIRNLVYDNILMDERCKFSFVENQVSILDLLKIQENRYMNSKKYFHQCLDGESQYIDLAYFSESWRASNCDCAINMNFWFTQIGNIICKKTVPVSIKYCDKELSLLHEEMLKLELLKGNKSVEEIKKVENEIRLFKDTMFGKYKDSLTEIAHFGINNHYNQGLKLNTVSREFVVRSDNRSFTLSLSSEILNEANRQFNLTYYYDWDSDIIGSNLSNYYMEDLHLGTWDLQTNIPYMKRLITKPVTDNYDRNIGNGIDSLFHNLKVYYEELPKYFQVGVDKVKSLRK